MEPATEEELACLEKLKTGGYIEEQLDAEDSGFLNDTTLLRFVRARDANVKKAAKMLNACIKWRTEYKPYKITMDQVTGILSLRTVYILGHCKRGFPVLYMTPGAKNPYDADVRVSLMVFLLEETLRMGHQKLTWVFDWSKFGERGRDDQSSKTREQVTKILQDYYPERLGDLYMVANPWWLSAVATLMWPFLDKRTRAKIHMSVTVEKLLDYIDEDQLVVHFGGKNDPDSGNMLIGSPAVPPPKDDDVGEVEVEA